MTGENDNISAGLQEAARGLVDAQDTRVRKIVALETAQLQERITKLESRVAELESERDDQNH